MVSLGRAGGWGDRAPIKGVHASGSIDRDGYTVTMKSVQKVLKKFFGGLENAPKKVIEIPDKW